MTSALDKRACSERAMLTERAVGEPLLALFAYSTLKAAAGGAGAGAPQEHPMLPRVSFGARTGGSVTEVRGAPHPQHSVCFGVAAGQLSGSESCPPQRLLLPL